MHSGCWRRGGNDCRLNTDTLCHRRIIASSHNKLVKRIYKCHIQYKKHLRHLQMPQVTLYIQNTLKNSLVLQEGVFYFFFSSSTVGAESLYLKRRIFCVAVFSKGSFMTSTELTCEDLFTFLFVILRIFAFQWSSFS